MPGNHVDDAAGDEEGRNLPRRLVGLQETAEIPLDGLDAPDAGAHGHADAWRAGGGDLDARVSDRLLRGRNPIVHERVHLARVLGRQVIAQLETRHRPAEARAEPADVEAGDRPNAAAPGDDVVPGIGHCAADGRHDAEAGYDYPTLAQEITSARPSHSHGKRRPLRRAPGRPFSWSGP